eukprot:c20666_g1_i2.p2 GENE.c20666_g1_i2~~c20666_g1_i2.p2  ORF type:complete len:122 (-),score=22.25 c20666_g1_i2:76-441(-)
MLSRKHNTLSSLYLYEHPRLLFAMNRGVLQSREISSLEFFSISSSLGSAHNMSHNAPTFLVQQIDQYFEFAANYRLKERCPRDTQTINRSLFELLRRAASLETPNKIDNKLEDRISFCIRL